MLLDHKIVEKTTNLYANHALLVIYYYFNLYPRLGQFYHLILMTFFFIFSIYFTTHRVMRKMSQDEVKKKFTPTVIKNFLN